MWDSSNNLPASAGMVVRSKAPLRLSFGGGGTDILPYPEKSGGVVLCVSLDKYSYCTAATRSDKSVTVQSLDYASNNVYHSAEDLQHNGKLDLVRGAVKATGTSHGISLFLQSDVPPGSGLGASSAMTVALVGALCNIRGLPLTPHDVASLAYTIERDEAGIMGGKQDQYAATFGGFNFIEFLPDEVIVSPLRLGADTLNELHYRLLLCYTGSTRLSAGIIEDQVSRYVRGQEDTANALDEIKAIAIAMKSALLMGEIDEFGHLLDQTWQAKKKLSPRITTPHIDELYNVALREGAIGGKLSGAGGGGYIVLVCGFNKKHVIAQALEKMGGRIVNFAFDFSGLQTWRVVSRGGTRIERQTGSAGAKDAK